MQQKYELGTRLTYFWHKNEKKIYLNFIFVFESLHLWYACRSFLLSKFASQIKLMQFVVGSVASLSVLGSHFQGPGCQAFASQGSRVPRSRVPGSRVSGSQGPGSQVLCLRVSGLQASGPGFRLCRWKALTNDFP